MGRMRIGTRCARRKLMCTDACANNIDRKQNSMATLPSRNLQIALAGPIARGRNNTHIPSIADNGISSIITERVSELNLSSYNLVRLVVQELSIASERGVATLPSKKPERGLLILLLVIRVARKHHQCHVGDVGNPPSRDATSLTLYRANCCD
jgi:hypothetical protein